MKRSKQIIIVLVLVLLVVIGGNAIYPYTVDYHGERLKSSEEYTYNENILLDFINNKLSSSDGGIYTNYKDETNSGDITKGHSILSESEGMMLIYYLYNGDKEKFEEKYNFIKENMLLDDNLLSWRIKDEDRPNVSATIDDLRITKALLYGSDSFTSIKYRNMALKISNSIYKNLITDNLPIDFKDESGKSNLSTLCYLDLPTLKMLNKLDKKWEKIYNESLKVVNEGFVSKELPLYRKYYNVDEKKYDDEKIDTLLSLIVINNKAECNEDVSESVNWIKEQLGTKGYLSSTYDIKTNEESKIESTAIYAMVAQLAKTINDNELYNRAIEKMKVFQITNDKSAIYGSFGDEKSESVFSYDNLNALLAFRKGWNYGEKEQ